MHDLNDRFDTLDQGFSVTLAQRPPAGRPKFLTVLCILTFVGTGLYLLVGSYGLIHTLNGIKASQDLVKEFGSDEEIAREIQSTLTYSLITQFVSLVGSLFCLIGAILMWRLKRIGYYLYLAGQIAPIVASIIFNLYDGFAYIVTIIFAFFPVVFLIMYTVNYKHLK